MYIYIYVFCYCISMRAYIHAKHSDMRLACVIGLLGPKLEQEKPWKQLLLPCENYGTDVVGECFQS